MKTSRTPLLTGLLTSAFAVCLVGTSPARAQAAQPAQPAEQAQQQAQQQEQPPPPPPEAPPAEGQQAPPETPPAEPTEAPAEPGAPSVEDRLANVEGQMEGLTEPFSAMQASVASMARLKFSGYVQGRYEWHDDANYGREQVGTSVVNRGTNRFYVRRARLKATYAGTLSEYVLQIDATGDGVVLRDAEASFVLTNENPWIPSATPWELKITMGQFKDPFGFEVLQSSSDREFPERSLMVRNFFPGERDRGIRLQYSYDIFRLQAAVVNGNFTNDTVHTTFDQSSWKDVLGRIGVDIEFLNVGVSGYTGRYLTQLAAPSAMMPVGTYRRFSRLRLGADAQLYIDIPGLGGLSLRGETIWGREEEMDFGGVAAPANKCNDVDRFGWYAVAVQNIGDYLGLAVRVDQFDSTFSIPDACQDMAKRTDKDRNNKTGVDVTLLGYISGNLKASVTYTHVGEHELKKKDDDAITVQLQAKF